MNEYVASYLQRLFCSHFIQLSRFSMENKNISKMEWHTAQMKRQEEGGGVEESVFSVLFGGGSPSFSIHLNRLDHFVVVVGWATVVVFMRSISENNQTYFSSTEHYKKKHCRDTGLYFEFIFVCGLFEFFKLKSCESKIKKKLRFFRSFKGGQTRLRLISYR